MANLCHRQLQKFLDLKVPDIFVLFEQNSGFLYKFL
jgi:hypothetical protein